MWEYYKVKFRSGFTNFWWLGTKDQKVARFDGSSSIAFATQTGRVGASLKSGVGKGNGRWGTYHARRPRVGGGEIVG